MNMSEFDGQMNQEDTWPTSISLSGHTVPDDFSDEDVAFAQELGSFFDVEQENLPPYFVQTLLDSENPQFSPVEPGFEHKARVRVFRRLKLHRRLFGKKRPSLQMAVAALPVRRPLIACGMAMVMFMLMTVIITAPSFAAGMEILLSGGKTGVWLVHDYPRGIHTTRGMAAGAFGDYDASSGEKQISLSSAQLQLHFNIYWPLTAPDSYTLNNIYLYQEPQQQWTDGPFIEFDYALPDSMTHGSGTLAVREIKLDPAIKVLQVVKDGAAQTVDISQDGQVTAIYVDGQWELLNKNHVDWVYGQRCELIYQRDGIVFWIVGDQRDGMNESTLMTIAQSLQPLDITRALHNGLQSHLKGVTLQGSDVNDAFSGDVLAIFSSDSTIGPYLSVVGANSSQSQPAPKQPAQQSVNIMHLMHHVPYP